MASKRTSEATDGYSRLRGCSIASKKKLEKTLIHMLHKQARYGESKHAAKQAARADYLKTHGTLKGYNPSRVDGIFSYGTMRTYTAAARSVAAWAHDNGIRRAADFTPDRVTEYLQHRQGRGLSCWTISRDLACCNKLFGYDLKKSDCGLSYRRQADIKRSRHETQNDRRDFSKHSDAMTFAHATGCRRQSIERVKISDVKYGRDGLPCAVMLREKGGLKRLAPILNEYKSRIDDIIQARLADHGKSARLFPDKYDSHIDNHDFRARYAADLIHQLQNERDLGQALFQGNIQIADLLKNRSTPTDKKYKSFDRDIAYCVSVSLGHSRLGVLSAYNRYM